MSTVQEIESAISHLPPKEKWDLLHRLLVSVKACSEPGADARPILAMK